VNSNYNISPKQRRIQQLVAQLMRMKSFGSAWKASAAVVAKLHPRITAKLKKQLDLLEFASARPPQDCVGFWQANTDAR